jgi:histidinol-phosphate aminotransferase
MKFENCIQNGVSRRSFLRTLGAASAAAATLPAMAYGQQQGGRRGGGMSDMGETRQMSPDTVIISSNENPLGPSQAALTALCATAPLGGRYHQEESMKTVAVLNELFGMPKPSMDTPSYVALFPGSGGPLDLALMSNIGPDKPLVMGDPSYEQGTRAAMTMKAPLFPVKLTPTYAHDVKAMLAAHPSPGAYYIVNPNNPTGTMTSRADIEWLVDNQPKGSVVIVDEAYHHFSNDESCIGMVAAGKNIIVLRTFSKIYGMAGLRAGVVFAKPEYQKKFTDVAAPARSLASISITSAAAARASLQDKDLIPLRRKINADVREETLAFMKAKGYKVVPGSQANFFMVDTGVPQIVPGVRGGGPFQKAMMAEKVAIGRTWPSMPTYVRVTVGTKDEMAKFQTAFVKCMDKKPDTANGASLYLPEYHAPSELYRGEMYA